MAPKTINIRTTSQPYNYIKIMYSIVLQTIFLENKTKNNFLIKIASLLIHAAKIDEH